MPRHIAAGRGSGRGRGAPWDAAASTEVAEAIVDRNADYPFYGGYLRRFPRFARTIVLDKRGAGASDRDVGSASPEDRMDDVRAVLDAVGSERAALLGQMDGGARRSKVPRLLYPHPSSVR